MVQKSIGTKSIKFINIIQTEYTSVLVELSALFALPWNEFLFTEYHQRIPPPFQQNTEALPGTPTVAFFAYRTKIPKGRIIAGKH